MVHLWILWMIPFQRSWGHWWERAGQFGGKLNGDSIRGRLNYAIQLHRCKSEKSGIGLEPSTGFNSKSGSESNDGQEAKQRQNSFCRGVFFKCTSSLVMLSWILQQRGIASNGKGILRMTLMIVVLGLGIVKSEKRESKTWKGNLRKSDNWEGNLRMPLMIVVLGLGIVMLVCVVVLVALLLCNNSGEDEDCRLVNCYLP